MSKIVSLKRIKKEDRELRILMGLIELYIESGKPVGSHTLQENGFSDLSSATIRNYCAKLEEMGLLMQQHTSGGRIPTESAFQLYAIESLQADEVNSEIDEKLESLRHQESKDPPYYLQNALELLSEITGLAAFISSPRFDHDFIADIKLVPIDVKRLLAIIVTHFGLIQTELLYTDLKLGAHALKRIEGYFLERLHGNPITSLSSEESKLAEHFYHEIIVRYIAKQTNFSESDLFETGFSKLLHYPEFADLSLIASTLGLFENRAGLVKLIQDTMKKGKLTLYIGKDLDTYSPTRAQSTLISIPYYLNRNIVGALGVLGPLRIPYKHIIAILKLYSNHISESLTKSLYKFKLHYRTPKPQASAYLELSDKLLLEDKTRKDNSNE